MGKGDILLCSTLHDPNGVFLERINNASYIVLQNYKGWVVNVTSGTNDNVKAALRELSTQGVYVTEADPKHKIVSDSIENDHLNCLANALEISKQLKVEKIQYTDGDRIITAATHYPEDLRKTAHHVSELTGTKLSYLGLRRSLPDTLTHHAPLVLTEAVFNGIYSQAFGIQIDIASTAHSMSRDVLEEIIKKSPGMETVSFPHPKWLIIAKEAGANIQSIETKKVLSFETPDQFVKNVEAKTGKTYPDRGNYGELQTNYLNTLGQDSFLSEKEWRLRFSTSQQYLSVLKNNLGILKLNPDREEKIRSEIDSSLNLIEKEQKETIVNLNRMSGEKNRA